MRWQLKQTAQMMQIQDENKPSNIQTEHTREVIVEVLPRRMRMSAILHDLYSMHLMRYPRL